MPEMLVDAVTESLAEQLRDYIANGLDTFVLAASRGLNGATPTFRRRVLTPVNPQCLPPAPPGA